MDLNKYPTPHPQVATRTVDGSAVIVLADSGLVNVLNEVGTRAWELMDGSRNLYEIIAAIQDEYEVSASEATEDIQSLTQTLLDANALVLQDTPSSST